LPRRELLTPDQRFQLFAFPADESELIRLASSSTEDFTFVRRHRGGLNRLGIAVLMVYLRYPSGCWDLLRGRMRREHLQKLLVRLDLVQFSRKDYRALVELLLPVAM